ncbi:MAG TPA: TrbC/VirB2 family protein [Candidatus Sulfotelmatobacter sp.]|nr:TrbC/VirB2 family protein [Candidatus Sulfotelmatobacter sp.]
MKRIKKVALVLIAASPVYFYSTSLADSGNIGQVESFLQNVITTVAGLAGLIATGFFIVGGLRYITSAGNPMHLDKAKRTILYSALGLAITIGAFVLSNIVTSLANNAFGGQ